MVFSEDRYRAALEELCRRSPSVQTCGFGADSYKPGLEGMLVLDAACGSPSKRLKCIHVAGTNGKGSVCSMLASSLAGTGLRVGLYTSPHLLDFRERIKICGNGSFRMIDKEYVLDFLDGTDTSGRSFFEVTTAMAFDWFDRERVDFAVIETGLGGRLDSTNIVDPEIAVITGIGLDHCAILGDTRSAIASEKAGIFKPGRPALVWGRDPETFPVFERAAASVGARLCVAEDIVPREDVCGWPLDLRSDCQGINLRTVLAALRLLGIGPDRSAICRAAALTGLRGRWERLSSDPDVICDIGHNPSALRFNFAALEASGKHPVIVYGVMADKDSDACIALMPQGATVIPCAPGTPRSLPCSPLAASLRRLRPDLDVRSTAGGTVREAVRLATALATPQDIVYIGGSTFVVAEAVAVG